MSKISSSDLTYNIVGFVCDPVSEQIINNVIKNLGIAYSVVFRGQLTDVIDFLKENRTPKILIIDISDSELPLGEISKIKEFSAPNVNILAIGSRNDVGLFRDLMEIGILDYLIKPLNNSLLSRSVEKASGTTKKYVEKKGKMIQFISSVGGAGSTTAVANVGWILANRHFKRTIAMDMDFFYGTVHLMLDVKTESAYLDILESPDKVDDYFVETILKKCDQRFYYLGGLVDLLRDINIDIRAFEALMDLVKRQFNYLLVDSQRELNNVNRVCMEKSDGFVVMVEMSIASAQNTMRILEMLRSSQHDKKIIVVANKVGLSSIGALTKESFEKIIDKKIDYIMPLDENVALAAANIGQPLAMSNGPLTNVLEDLANDILGKRENQEIAQAVTEQKGWTADRIKDLAADTLEKLITQFK
ncbi:MAG: AAA family ATPase [Holosporaceae bacterium]|jgi:pilus assembly protein CpaE|nr:AAA family ATPase [Holosporaceae bacterium]